MTSVQRGASKAHSKRTEDPIARFRAVDRPLHRAATLPGWMFSDPGVFSREMESLFRTAWTCIGRADELPNPGDFRTYEVGGSGIIVLRDGEGSLRAFHNVCRHRGTRILDAGSGTGMTLLQCPYHAWTYSLDGTLRGAPHMDMAEDFEQQDFGLYAVAVEEWRGFLFVNLAPEAPPLRDFLGDFTRRAAPYPLERLRRAHRHVYEIAANWKLVVQNANECYHCPGVHPQLVRVTPYRSGEEDFLEGPIFGGWMDFVPNAATLSPDGTTSRRFFARLSREDLRRVYYYVLYPSNFLSLLPDYVTLDWFIPLSPERTRLVFDLYVDRDEPDAAQDAMEFWDLTNRQDWHICELAHLGSKTSAYTQGRYSTEEDAVHAIDRFYLKAAGYLPRRTVGPRSLRRSPRRPRRAA